MEKKELAIILKKHSAWLNGEECGARANLQGANLQGASLQGASLQGANLQDANLLGASLQDANLQGANLLGASLQDANLQGANLDYSCLPIWCGGSKFKADMRIVRQTLAHVCTIEIMDADEGMKAAIEAILPEAKKSHRAPYLGIL